MTEKTINHRCPECGFHIRGENHEEGQHHNLSTEYNRQQHNIKPIRCAPVGKR